MLIVVIISLAKSFWRTLVYSAQPVLAHRTFCLLSLLQRARLYLIKIGISQHLALACAILPVSSKILIYSEFTSKWWSKEIEGFCFDFSYTSCRVAWIRTQRYILGDLPYRFEREMAVFYFDSTFMTIWIRLLIL